LPYWAHHQLLLLGMQSAQRGEAQRRKKSL
jgi:hypothetical protein